MDVFKTLILDTPDSLDNISGVLPVVNGGTGADNAPDARDNLGLGTMATQDANAVAITGGSATGLTSLGVVDNATLGSSNTDTVTFNARIASEFTPATDNTYDLGRVGHEWRDLYIDGTANIDSLVADTAGINGGTIDDTTIGATTPAAGTFSQVNSTGAIIATGAGSFGDDTDITGDLTVTGNVGIGAAPATKLHVQTATNGGIVVNDGTVNGIIYGSTTLTNSFAIGTTSNHPLIFGTNNSFPQMTLATSGNVGIGLTGPSYQLQLSTDSAAKPSTNTWTIASDARIKTETGEYTKGLDAVLSLRPITYRYNGKAGMVDDGEDKISIIAQEAVNAFPECVGSYMTKLDEDDEEETEVLNWNGHALTFALVNSIKELAARLEALENN